MINKKLDEIKASLGVIEELMQDNKYLENLDKGLEKEKHINIDLQNRINKTIEYIDKNKQKTIAAYGDNYDDDFEICLWEEDIDNLLEILRGGK